MSSFGERVPACLRDATAELSKAESAVQVLRERAEGIIEATDLRA